MELTNNMISGIKNSDLFYLATCSNEKIPNVVPIKCVKWIGNNKVLVADNFMKKTKQNILDNPHVSFVLKEAREYPFQFKGKVKIYGKGEYFDEAVKMVEKYRPKSALVIEINEIYSVNSKDKPGELILK
ncbi:MAG: pyridoxamine 5'-phosphate oxidase family protein [Nanoarchaeota archaeon]|nr:pyridoxamine 5'-phosphate oxidase family protein [Nanoarchaeota archaeon]MBU1005723.1 pyridoxamine 5'-phosphate oxidase family protein [Nanoarchaeota archaeon]MBU1945592.1 pyridoxamine 5'-phosphate oxidase family protein [Nanoarchaeota archaeon]